jgi:site-specific DNA recombinase
MRSPVGCDDLLAGWMAASRPVRSARIGRTSRTSRGGVLRFAFYRRISTDDFQDLASSRVWQRTAAEDVIAGHGRVVAEYFDVGCSRRRPWRQRPQAAALLAAAADPDRGFDAIVVGEYERAFYGEQLTNLAPVLAGHGVQVLLPEAGGWFDHRLPAHQVLTMLLGAQARREEVRARFRTTAAMVAQAREQGRYLGGRPPYGYRLVDAGPHRNAVHAGWGRRLQRLDPDPATAPIVR